MKSIICIAILILTFSSLATFASAETYTLNFNSTGITNIKEDNNSTPPAKPLNSTGITNIKEDNNQQHNNTYARKALCQTVLIL